MNEAVHCFEHFLGSYFRLAAVLRAAVLRAAKALFFLRVAAALAAVARRLRVAAALRAAARRFRVCAAF